MSWFFDQYLYRREVPELIYSFEGISGQSKWTLYYKWNSENTNRDFRLPLYIFANDTVNQILPSDKVQALEIYNSHLESPQIDLEDYVIFTKSKEALSEEYKKD